MERIVELTPLEGIVLDSLSIRLGDAKADVERTLGPGEPVGNRSLYYFKSELRVDFDGGGRVEFIELLGGPDGTLQPSIYGINPFRAEPDEVYALLKEKNSGEIDDREKGYSYAFLNLSAGLWRRRTPDSIAEMIEEAQEEGYSLSEDEIEDETRLTHWATIGVGIKDYYK